MMELISQRFALCLPLKGVGVKLWGFAKALESPMVEVGRGEGWGHARGASMARAVAGGAC